MINRNAGPSTWQRRLLQAVIATVGIVAIVGSGGGFPDLSYDFDPGSISPSVWVSPSRITVQPGDTVEFRATAVFAATYQWRRDGVDIAGASSLTYKLVGADLGDDGAQFSIVVSNRAGTATATALLQVSRFPPVAFVDGDFQPANWTAQPLNADPAQGGHKVTVSRAESGGYPGAYRSITYEMPAGPSSITVIHASASATYDPATGGTIYGIDFTMACNWFVVPTFIGPALEQAGRRFVRDDQWRCYGSWGSNVFTLLSSRPEDFAQLDGPPCEAGEACPDFSASGAPLLFGFWTRASVALNQPAATFSQGIDNWRVTVWKK